MSDMGRQSLGDKAAAAVKPDSEKSYLEQGEYLPQLLPSFIPFPSPRFDLLDDGETCTRSKKLIIVLSFVIL